MPAFEKPVRNGMQNARVATLPFQHARTRTHTRQVPNSKVLGTACGHNRPVLCAAVLAGSASHLSGQLAAIQSRVCALQAADGLQARWAKRRGGASESDDDDDDGAAEDRAAMRHRRRQAARAECARLLRLRRMALDAA